jgi:hypothetical protein
VTSPIPLPVPAASRPALSVAPPAARSGEAAPDGLFAVLLAALFGGAPAEAAASEVRSGWMGEGETGPEEPGGETGDGRTEDRPRDPAMAVAVVPVTAPFLPVAVAPDPVRLDIPGEAGVPLPVAAEVPAPAVGESVGEAPNEAASAEREDRRPAGAAGRTETWLAPSLAAAPQPPETPAPAGAEPAPVAALAAQPAAGEALPPAPPELVSLPEGAEASNGGGGRPIAVRPLARSSASAPVSPVAFRVELAAAEPSTCERPIQPDAPWTPIPEKQSSAYVAASPRAAASPSPAAAAKPPAPASPRVPAAPSAGPGPAPLPAQPAADPAPPGPVREPPGAAARRADAPDPGPAAASPASPAAAAEHAAQKTVNPQPPSGPPALPPAVEVRAAGPARREETPTVGPARPAEPIAPEPVSRTEPVRDLAFRLEGASETVDVRLSARGDAVHVSVHTADADLAGTLRQHLGDLESRLETRGYQAQSWQARAPAEAARAGSDAGYPSGDPAGQQYQGRGGSHPERRGQQSRRTNAARERKDFAWIVSQVR